MLSTDEIMVRMGLDTRAVHRELKSISNVARDWGRDFKNSITNAFTKFGGALTIGAVTAAVGSFVRSTLQYAEHLQDLQEAYGISAEFFQGFAAKVARTGGNFEMAEKGLAKFMVTLGQAREGKENAITKLLGQKAYAGSPEEVLLALADAFAQIPDPAQRAAVNAEIFGKKAGAIGSALAGGREEMVKFIASVEKLSTAELEAIHTTEVAWDEFHRNRKVDLGIILGEWAALLTTIGGKKVSGGDVLSGLLPTTQLREVANQVDLLIRRHAEYIGPAVAKRTSWRQGAWVQNDADRAAAKTLADDELKRSMETGTALGKLQAIHIRIAELKKIMAASDEKSAAHLNAKNESEKLGVELTKQRAAMAKAEAAQQEKIADLTRQQARTMEELTEAMEDRSRMSLKDLAGMTPGGFAPVDQAIRDARELEWLENSGMKRAGLFARRGHPQAIRDLAAMEYARTGLQQRLAGLIPNSELNPEMAQIARLNEIAFKLGNVLKVTLED